MSMNERRDSLDPGRDPLGWERAVGAIMEEAEPELRRRRNAAWVLPDRWARPVFAAAASLIFVACGSLLWTTARPPGVGGGAGVVEVVPGFEEALYPPVVARWIQGRAEPTVEELVFASTSE